jgi:hypothetical protein
MIDAPLQVLIGLVAALAFWQSGDRPWLAVAKGALVSLVASVIMSVALWVSS